MRTSSRRRWRVVRGFLLGWVAAFVFLAIVRGSGTVERGSANFALTTAILVAIPFGAVVGLVAGWTQVLIEERFYRRIPLGRLIAARAVVVFFVLIGINGAGYLVVTSLLDVEIGFREFLVEPGSAAILLYILTVDALLVGLRQVNLLLGEGNLWRVLKGEFYTPREAERIFMFLDMRASTTLAESLGHIRYSRLIQDCFDDLGVAAHHEARVYQYVGDGAVLVWDVKEGLRDRNCLEAFGAFRARLRARSDHYGSEYGIQPHFSAGVHLGVVTVTEVGRFKKEIAYHGDTINTAARIQGQCGVLGEDLLLSGALLERFGEQHLGLEPLGSLPLKGKERSVALFASREPSVSGEVADG